MLCFPDMYPMQLVWIKIKVRLQWNKIWCETLKQWRQSGQPKPWATVC